ncbi:cytochrome P450 736A117-like [Silene latifolia]|uniref:cytochrome P450 736A117-like n=1 Tax=Silene latifolia TaxID=37657 RepID=UPI003D776F27
MLLSFQSLLIVFQFIIFTFLVYKYIFRTKSPCEKNLPPSPPKLPIFGNIHQLGTHPHRTLRTLSEKYGELMVIHLGQIPTLVVSSAKAATEIMKTHDSKFSSRAPNKTANKLLYNCKNVARTPYGEYWRQAKSICVLQLLSAKRVLSFRSVREEEMVLLMEKIDKSSVVNFSDLVMTLTSDILCRVAFGRKYSAAEGGIDFKKLLQEFEGLLGRFRVGDFIPFLAWTDKLDGWDAKVDKVAKGLDQFFETVLEEHQNSRKNGNHNGVKDLVDVLLDVQEGEMAGIPIERDSIKGVILDMFSAGTDTTFTVLEWAMTELLRNYAVMQELKNEVRGITGKKAYVHEDDLEQMKYLKAVIKETLRLHPSIPLLVPRLSTQDAKINGYDIPSGTLVINNAWAIQRNPASWDDPEEFIPERFLNCSTDYRGQDFELIPFGAGRRICPGITFAIANIELVLANLIHKFDWTLPDGAKSESLDVKECVGLTVHRETHLLVIAVPVNAGN